MAEEERIVLIEWNHDGTIHQFVTAENDDCSYLHTYDVNWYEGQGYFHGSGCGPGPRQFMPGKVEGYRGKLWAHPAITFRRWLPPVRGTVSIERDKLHEIGYDLIDEFPGDPRPDLIEGDGYVCEHPECEGGTWRPYDEPCVHEPQAEHFDLEHPNRFVCADGHELEGEVNEGRFWCPECNRKRRPRWP